ncbi:MAG: tRNA (adenosine(37)-N6)-threonylcarbamoyltransferase complex dimerization subunit type 1 TsaB [Bacteroidales bacterium]|nr:tRNA (adenosine(37)-N6)-threonylcarbamoyltransferase complex dimerization subunit type 1 TsaB [Bacteroidales bacterium]
MPYILSIDTSTDICSVALFQGTEQVAFRESAEGRSHAKILLPFIEETLKDAGVRPDQLQAVAVSMGPGSYTGLRIGVSTAKGLCYSLDIPLIAVPTLQIIAAGARPALPSPDTLLCPMLDARRMEVFTALYDQQLHEIQPFDAVIVEEGTFAEILGKSPVLFCGNGMEKCRELLSASSNSHFDSTPISARNMGEIALQKFNRQQFEDVAYCEPQYGKEYVAAKPNVKGLH